MPTGSNLRDFFGALADPNQGAEPEAGQADQAVATEDPNQSSTSDQADPNQFADPNSGQVDAPTGVADPDQFADPNSGQVDAPTDVADPDQFADPNSGQVDQPTDVADPDQFSDPNSGQVDASADSGAANPLEFLTSAVADVLPDEFSASADLSGSAGGGDIADGIIAKLDSGADLRLEVGALSRMDMRGLLDVMTKLKQADRLNKFSEVGNLNERIGVAILTILPDLAGQWQQLVAKLSPAERQAVLERVPKDDAAQFGTTDDPSASQAEAEKALTAFLEKVQKAQGGSILRVSDTVRVAGNAVAFGIPNSDTKIKNLLARKDLTGQPAVLAHEIAIRLPASIPRSNLKRLAGLPVDEASGTQAQTFLAALVAGVIKEVDKLIKGLPKAVQDEIRKAVGDAIEAGVLAIVAQAMSDTKLDEVSKQEIKSIVAAAIKQHPSQSSFDNKQGTEGSPDARDRPPIIGPTQPEQPAITDEQKFKFPEIKTPDGPPPNPKPAEKPEQR